MDLNKNHYSTRMPLAAIGVILLLASACGSSPNSGINATSDNENKKSSGGFRLIEAFFTDGSEPCSGAGVEILFADFKRSRFIGSAQKDDVKTSNYIACNNKSSTATTLSNSSNLLAEAEGEVKVETGSESSVDNSKTTSKTAFALQCTEDMKASKKNTYLALSAMLNISKDAADDEATLCGNIFDAGYEETSYDFSAASPTISDVSPLKHFKGILKLNISNTQVATVAALNEHDLENLEIKGSTLDQASFVWKASSPAK